MNLELSLLDKILSPEGMRKALQYGGIREFFVNPLHQEVFDYILQSYQKTGTPPSKELLKEKFGLDLPETQDSMDNLLGCLAQRYQRGRLEQILLKAAKDLASDPRKSLHDLLKDALSLKINTKNNSNSYHYVERAKERLEDYVNRQTNGKAPTEIGCLTGWELFDQWTLGLRNGELGVLYAGTGKGKTYTMLRMALGAYAYGWNPLIISFEPTIKSLSSRLDSLVARINPKRYRSGMLTEEEKKRLEQRLELLQKYKRPFILVKPWDNNPITIAECLLENRMNESEKWVVFVDQMSFFSSKGERFEYYRNLFTDICRIIDDLNVPCWILAQENREGMKSERASLVHIALSSFTEQFADIVINLHREDYNSTSALLRIMKFREGKPADFAMEFDIDRGVIEVVGIVST